MSKEIKENLTGLMITLGTDTERKFAWCLRKIKTGNISNTSCPRCSAKFLFHKNFA